MIKVLKHGSKRKIQNPLTGKWQDTTNIVFVEEGARGGANSFMSESSEALSQAVGVEVGIQALRVHTHPVLSDTVGNFPVGKEFPLLFINRRMYSTPQMFQQAGVDSRMVDGKPTYFTTSISQRAESDADLRLDNNVLAAMDPNAFTHARIRATEVQSVEEIPTGLGITAEQPAQSITL